MNNCERQEGDLWRVFYNKTTGEEIGIYSYTGEFFPGEEEKHRTLWAVQGDTDPANVGITTERRKVFKVFIDTETGEELGGYSYATEGEGEEQATKALFAYDKGIPEARIFAKVVDYSKKEPTEPGAIFERRNENDFRLFIDMEDEIKEFVMILPSDGRLWRKEKGMTL